MIAKAGKRSFSNYKSAALPTELCRHLRAKSTFIDAILLGPLYLRFVPLGKTLAKKRTDRDSTARSLSTLPIHRQVALRARSCSADWQSEPEQQHPRSRGGNRPGAILKFGPSGYPHRLARHWRSCGCAGGKKTPPPEEGSRREAGRTAPGERPTHSSSQD